jgi:hypothetical protein
MTAGRFWELQQFSYIETYSFNRGAKLADLHAATTAVIEQIKLEMATAPFRDQRKLGYQLRTLQGEIAHLITEKPLTNKQGIFDATAERIALVKQDSAAAQRLRAIFEKPAKQVVHFMCLPIYRDALAFYGAQGQLLRVLNICFECLAMRTESGLTVEADIVAYEELQQLFNELGHPIEGA